MATVQDVVDLARVDINDDAKARWPDATLLKHFNTAMREAYALRPDLRLGGYLTAVADKALAEAFPLPDEYQRAIADRIISLASSVDAEHVDSGRVANYYQSFKLQLVGL